MKNLATILLGTALVAGASANERYILRYTESEPLGTFLARYNLRLRATVANQPIHAVVDPLNRNAASLIQRISDDTDDDVSIEQDQVVRLPILSFRTNQTSALSLLNQAASQSSNINFFGANAPLGAIRQYAVPQVRADASWPRHGLGTGLVAVIDTGIDPNHPFFAGKVARGIDLITNGGSASELTGLSPEVLALINPTTTPLLRTRPAYVSRATAAFFPASTSSDPNFGKIPIGLGHGTMVAGAIRLVAPGVRILPVRAFGQNGTGRLFDIIRGMHLSEQRGARVINMSLNTYTYSRELERSSDELSDRGVILVASTGNDGYTQIPSYPAAFQKVTGVASLNPNAGRSTFSNAGELVTWVSAPGEALLLPFPGNRWAGGWGTSFSAPLVSGLASKMLLFKPSATYSDLQSALGKSQPLGDPNLGLGRLDVFSSMAGL